MAEFLLAFTSRSYISTFTASVNYLFGNLVAARFFCLDDRGWLSSCNSGLCRKLFSPETAASSMSRNAHSISFCYLLCCPQLAAAQFGIVVAGAIWSALQYVQSQGIDKTRQFFFRTSSAIRRQTTDSENLCPASDTIASSIWSSLQSLPWRGQYVYYRSISI